MTDKNKALPPIEDERNIRRLFELELSSDLGVQFVILRRQFKIKIMGHDFSLTPRKQALEPDRPGTMRCPDAMAGVAKKTRFYHVPLLMAKPRLQ